MTTLLTYATVQYPLSDPHNEGLKDIYDLSLIKRLANSKMPI